MFCSNVSFLHSCMYMLLLNLRHGCEQSLDYTGSKTATYYDKPSGTYENKRLFKKRTFVSRRLLKLKFCIF